MLYGYVASCGAELQAGPIIGAVVIAANARLLGIIPAVAVGVAWVLVNRIGERREPMTANVKA